MSTEDDDIYKALSDVSDIYIDTKIAKACYEVVRSYRHMEEGIICDKWDLLTRDARDDVLYIVRYKRANTEATCEDVHNAWMEDKIAKGWIYVTVEEKELKATPYLVQYGKLPYHRKMCYVLSVAVITAFFE
jgi:hypothetical protein